MSYTEQEFNEAMAVLDGHRVEKREDGELLIFFQGKDVGELLHVFGDYYNDLNYLMPLVFKYDFQIYKSSANEWNSEIWMNDDQDLIVWKNIDPLKTIRDCLFELSQERKA